MDNKRNPYVPVFKGGHIVDVKPMPAGNIYESRDILYSADEIISDDVRYDLRNRASIYSIEVPDYDLLPQSPIAQSLGITGNLEYVLRMRSGRYWNDGQYGLSTTCLGQATKLMLFSDCPWPKRDYFRIVNELIDLGRLKKAKEWEKWIDNNVPDDLSANIPQKELYPDFNYLFNEARYLETDLVESSDISGCCEKCAKYRNRIFSLSGKDSRFPKLPNDFHINCGVSLHPFIYGIMEPTFTAKDIIRYSNRPFVDDRTQEEISAYQSRFTRIQQAQENLIYEPNPARTSYYLIKKYFPDLAPKSMSGYMRMYNAKSKNYLKLVDTVTSEGLRLPETIDDLYELEESGDLAQV